MFSYSFGPCLVQELLQKFMREMQEMKCRKDRMGAKIKTPKKSLGIHS